MSPARARMLNCLFVNMVLCFLIVLICSAALRHCEEERRSNLGMEFFVWIDFVESSICFVPRNDVKREDYFSFTLFVFP